MLNQHQSTERVVSKSTTNNAIGNSSSALSQIQNFKLNESKFKNDPKRKQHSQTGRDFVNRSAMGMSGS